MADNTFHLGEQVDPADHERTGDGAVLVLPEAKTANQTFYSGFATDLKNHLHRSQSVELHRNEKLKLFSEWVSRPRSSPLAVRRPPTTR